MTALRDVLLRRAEEETGVLPEYPWAEDPESAVLRRADNRKCFGLFMRIPRDRLGLAGADKIDILNVKCNPLLIGGLLARPGFHRAWHMNKNSWIRCASTAASRRTKSSGCCC